MRSQLKVQKNIFFFFLELKDVISELKKLKKLTIQSLNLVVFKKKKYRNIK